MKTPNYKQVYKPKALSYLFDKDEATSFGVCMNGLYELFEKYNWQGFVAIEDGYKNANYVTNIDLVKNTNRQDGRLLTVIILYLDTITKKYDVNIEIMVDEPDKDFDKPLYINTDGCSKLNPKNYN